MTLMLCLTIGILFGTGAFLLLRRNVLKVILGLSLLSHGANILLVTSGGFGGRRPPIIGVGSLNYVDPLPQALVLTAIVISFGVTGFLLALLYRIYRETRAADTTTLRRLSG